MSGIVEEAGENSPTVKFIGASGSITIPRARVKSIQREPMARGYMHIGDSFIRQGDLESALKAYMRAAGADPESAEARELIQTTQAALDRRQRLDRQDDIGEIERGMAAAIEVNPYMEEDAAPRQTESITASRTFIQAASRILLRQQPQAAKCSAAVLNATAEAAITALPPASAAALAQLD
ncbi:hypothetical protein IIC65_01705, partial [Candidatus Sumerlaeota bacterium]|nr:hypothetical protein [Candidatus Sumerlaeota bacterium]